MGYDFVTWGAVACVLSALGGVLSWLAWRRRGLAAGLRGLAWSILPIAAWLTGTLHLAANVAGDVGAWALHLVFSPVVWLGIVAAGVAVVLFGASGAMRARGVGTRGRPRVAGAGKAPIQQPGSKPRQNVQNKSASPDDMDDIEAILRRHGIS